MNEPGLLVGTQTVGADGLTPIPTGSMLPGLTDTSRMIREINPTGLALCGNTALACDAWLSGRPACACPSPFDPDDPDQPLRTDPADPRSPPLQHDVSDKELDERFGVPVGRGTTLASALRGRPQDFGGGARFLVAADSSIPERNHLFNATLDDDGQTFHVVNSGSAGNSLSDHWRYKVYYTGGGSESGELVPGWGRRVYPTGSLPGEGGQRFRASSTDLSPPARTAATTALPALRTVGTQTVLGVAYESGLKPWLEGTGLAPGRLGDATVWCGIGMLADPTAAGCAAGAATSLGSLLQRTDTTAPPMVRGGGDVPGVLLDGVSHLAGAGAKVMGAVQSSLQLGSGGLVPPGSKLGGIAPGTDAQWSAVDQDVQRSVGSLGAAVPALQNFVMSGTVDGGGCAGLSVCGVRSLFHQVTGLGRRPSPPGRSCGLFVWCGSERAATPSRPSSVRPTTISAPLPAAKSGESCPAWRCSRTAPSVRAEPSPQHGGSPTVPAKPGSENAYGWLQRNVVVPLKKLFGAFTGN